MKRTILVMSLVTVLGIALYAGNGRAMGPEMMGQGRGMGQGMMAGDMMRGMMGGSMMDGGMMGRGVEPERRDRYDEHTYRQPRAPLSESEARRMVEDYLRSTRNPNLKLGQLRDLGKVFEAEILTKEDSLVDRILVDKNTGSMRSLY
jgi:hypothetical protein